MSKRCRLFRLIVKLASLKVSAREKTALAQNPNANFYIGAKNAYNQLELSPDEQAVFTALLSYEEAMNWTLKNLIAFALFATWFAQPAFAQQVQLTLVQVKAGKMETATELTTELVEQTYTVQIPYTETVTQQYTVEIPYTETVNQKYSVDVPYTETVTGADGKEKEVQKTRTEQREREVVVQKTKSERKTRMVPVTRMRTETRIRKVPVTRQGGEMKTVQFPPANAKFAYVSGKEIPVEEIKKLAAEKITILQLRAGETLSDLQRQILKPDLVVMTMLPKMKPKKPSGFMK